MADLRATIQEKQPLTMGETIAIAKQFDVPVTDVVIEEAEIQTGLPKDEILTNVMNEYAHNLEALRIGMTPEGESILLGKVASQLGAQPEPRIFKDKFLDDALLYTLAAQVGNHCIGLRPCAGTGDSCPYAGFVKAMQVNGVDEVVIAEIACLIVKVGSLFRVGKVTTGCNMEGYGAGSAAIAAATVALEGGTPDQMEKAMVLALSPTIGVPCTPRVLVPALCTTHVGGAIMNGIYSGRLCMAVDMQVNVPFDVMISMASLVHIESGHHIVPTVVEYMEPFFKRKPEVESLVSQEVKDNEAKEIQDTLKKADEIAKKMAKGTRPITKTFGDAVVGGSSQAVGSPTNAARIAHELIKGKGKIKRIRVELYPELFARRSINIPGVLMGAAYGSSTGDYKMYKKSVQMVKDDGIQVDIVRGEEHSIQKITIDAENGSVTVDALNRGGGRLVLRDATPSRDEAVKVAEELGIVLVEQ